jgi:streptogramin lyase
MRALVYCVVLAPWMMGNLASAAEPVKRWATIREPGDFVVALANDPGGYVWIGTEDNGVWRYDPKAEVPKHIKKFSTKDGLGDDNAYAIAVDKLGRVWVGHLNHGVSVFNGEKWKNYDVLDGPIGERIFAIATCPTDGDVWMATSCGLTRYSLKKETWGHYTRTDGLPSDQVNCLAFDSQGDLYVGTQCHGIAVARAKDNYGKWTVTTGPGVQLPTTSSGSGLPTSLINGIVVTTDGTVYAATCAGLAWSKDKGATWRYIRGRDYVAKVRERLGGAPQGWREPGKEVVETLIPEDYVSCLAEDSTGLIWVGFRQSGFFALNPKNFKTVFRGSGKESGLPDDYIFTILPRSDSKPVLGTYGGGTVEAVLPFENPSEKKAETVEVKAVDKEQALPPVVKLPAKEELASALKQVLDSPKSPALAAYVVDDWLTQGDFYGTDKLKNYRYGEWHATLCAFASPFDGVWGRKSISCWGRIGSNKTKDDSLRHWVHSAETDNIRCLKNPFMDKRRQSEWDDHGEAYSMSHEGPHVYANIDLPEGPLYLSLYFYNKDGHEGHNRFRDYLVTVKEFAETDTEFNRAPVLAQGRVQNFWGGVYKVFGVQGGKRYTIQIHDNWSFNTIVSGVFVDPILISPSSLREERDISRVRLSLPGAELTELGDTVKRKSPLANDIFEALSKHEQARSRHPLDRLSQHRLVWLMVLQALREEAQTDNSSEGLRRVRAQGFNNLRRFDDRDTLYGGLEKTK